MSGKIFERYVKDGVFDFAQLINDDFFSPVRILFNARHYVSATKLLLVAVDSIGFIEYGEGAGLPFVRWLDKYADLSNLGITPHELWEHRNALLHMSSLNSRKVVAGKTRMLVSYVGDIPEDVVLDYEEAGYYNLYSLILVIGNACGKWMETYKGNEEKTKTFSDRYDLIVSDKRMVRFDFEDIILE